MLRAVSAALRGTMSGPSKTKLPKTTIAKVNKPATPATFAAVRCELFATANPSFGGSILLIVILFPPHYQRWLLLHGDYDFAVRVPFFQIAKRRLRLAHFVSAVDDRRYFSRLHQIAQNIQIVFGECRNVEDKLLAGEL